MESQMGKQLNECKAENEFAQLEMDIQGRLRHFIRDFRIIVRDGGLILHGWTRSFYGKQLVQHGVMARSRLPIRENKIDVL